MDSDRAARAKAAREAAARAAANVSQRVDKEGQEGQRARDRKSGGAAAASGYDVPPLAAAPAALGFLLNSKLTPCTSFVSAQGCIYGVACPLAHSLKELGKARRPFLEELQEAEDAKRRRKDDKKKPKHYKHSRRTEKEASSDGAGGYESASEQRDEEERFVSEASESHSDADDPFASQRRL